MVSSVYIHVSNSVAIYFLLLIKFLVIIFIFGGNFCPLFNLQIYRGILCCIFFFIFFTAHLLSFLLPLLLPPPPSSSPSPSPSLLLLPLPPPPPPPPPSSSSPSPSLLLLPLPPPLQGSPGLSLFYLHTRSGDGGYNGLELHRLKDKLGTRQLPTAELLLDGASAMLVS